MAIALLLAQPATKCTKLEKLKRELQKELLREMYGVDVVKLQATCHTSVFSDVVMAAIFSGNFKMPNIMSYDGKGDLATHVEVF